VPDNGFNFFHISSQEILKCSEVRSSNQAPRKRAINVTRRDAGVKMELLWAGFHPVHVEVCGGVVDGTGQDEEQIA
jgi:hypothetical protein